MLIRTARGCLAPQLAAAGLLALCTALPVVGGCGSSGTTPRAADGSTPLPDGSSAVVDANAPLPDGSSPPRDGGSADRSSGGTACQDTCTWASDGVCDDGGPNSEYSVCDFGTDCADCGPRDPSQCVRECTGVCGSDGCGGECGACPGGQACVYDECVTCGCGTAVCGTDPCGNDCGQCGANQGCSSAGTCIQCGCGTHACGYDPCTYESCGECTSPLACDYLAFTCVTPTAGCSNTCRWAGDGACDDGGPNSEYSVCELGTDCQDCGPRT